MKTYQRRGVALVAVLLLAFSGSAWAQFSPPSAGMVAWWRAEGNANDSSGNGHNGTLLDGVGFDTGKFGQAFSFAGNGNRAVIPDSASFSLTNSLSIGAWIYPLADSWVVLIRNGGPFTAYTFQLDDAGHFQFSIKDAQGAQDSLLIPISYSRWYQITATLDGASGVMRLYTNGTVAAEKITTVRPLGYIDSSYQPTITLGNTSNGGFPFIGLIDEVVLYSRALSPEEVQRLAQPLANRAEVLQILTFSITTFTQSTNYDNGTNRITAPPKVKSHDSAELLRTLARDENAAGRWPSNSFPSTAKLAVRNQEGFVVVNGTNILINVSDIMSFSGGDNEIRAGKEDDSTGLPSPTTKCLRLGKITFDDTFIQGGVGMKFFIQGLLSTSETDTLPIGGVYTQTKTGRIINGTGEGIDSDGNAFVLTGTVTVAGHGTEALVP